MQVVRPSWTTLAEALLNYCGRNKLIKACPKLVAARGGGLLWLPAGGLNHCVNRNINFIFGILTSIAIDWYMNESIMRGSKGGGGPGGVGEFWGRSPEIYWATFTKN